MKIKILNVINKTELHNISAAMARSNIEMKFISKFHSLILDTTVVNFQMYSSTFRNRFQVKVKTLMITELIHVTCLLNFLICRSYFWFVGPIKWFFARKIEILEIVESAFFSDIPWSMTKFTWYININLIASKLADNSQRLILMVSQNDFLPFCC